MNGGTGLVPKLTLTLAGGAQKIPYMVSLLASENLDVNRAGFAGGSNS